MRARTSASVSGPTCSPSTTRCQTPSVGASGAGAAPSVVPRTTMMWLHFLQRILKTLPRTLSSEMEYFVEQESQTIFISASLGAPYARGNPHGSFGWPRRKHYRTAHNLRKPHRDRFPKQI